jgi:hypothetical protein
LRLKALLLTVILACGSRDALAQARPSTVPVPPGSRVRVKTPTLVAPLVANFLEQRGDTLVFIEDGRGRGLWSFSLGQIERLEMTAGEGGRNKAPIAKGAAIGAGAGLVVGILFASVAKPSDESKKYSSALTGALGAAVGGGIGAYFGSRVKAERWVEVPLNRRLSLRARGNSLAISIPLSIAR